MAKKLSPKSQPERLVSVASKDILGKSLTTQQLAVVKRLAARQAAGDDSHINFSDIPDLSNEQPERIGLKRMNSEDIWNKPMTKAEKETLQRHADFRPQVTTPT